jgi:hypothetical protein
MKQVIELERKCGQFDREGVPHPKSIYQIHSELGAGLGIDEDLPVYMGGGATYPNDIREVIRLGLIGGNKGLVDEEEKEVGPLTASHLVDSYVYPARPLIESQHVAWSILQAAIVGVQVKKKAETSEAAEGLTPS